MYMFEGRISSAACPAALSLLAAGAAKEWRFGIKPRF